MVKPFLMFFLLVLLIPFSAHAHGIHVFATIEGKTITGSVYFSGGGKAKNVPVEIVGPNGKKLGRTLTNEKGEFSFNTQMKCDHRIVVQTPDGHRAECLVRAKDIGNNLSETALQDTIDRAVAKQIRPLREQLDRYERQVRFRDLLGGLGYILGLTGLILYFKASVRWKKSDG